MKKEIKNSTDVECPTCGCPMKWFQYFGPDETNWCPICGTMMCPEDKIHVPVVIKKKVIIEDKTLSKRAILIISGRGKEVDHIIETLKSTYEKVEIWGEMGSGHKPTFFSEEVDVL